MFRVGAFLRSFQVAASCFATSSAARGLSQSSAAGATVWLAAAPLKAVSNELAVMRSRKLVKKLADGRYAVVRRCGAAHRQARRTGDAAA